MTTEEIEVQEDRLEPRSIVLVVVAGLVIMALSIWIAYAILVADEGTILHGEGEGTRRGAVAPTQISRVRQTLIDRDREGLRDRLEARRDLESYAWADRERGLIRIPIRRAMELRAKGVRP